MNREKIEEMFRHGKYEKLVEELSSQIGDLDEFSMLRLAQTYLLLNDETNALKLIEKAQKKFMGNTQYAEEEEKLSNAIIRGSREEYIQKLTNGTTEEEYGSIRTDDVNPYFEAVVGMQEAKRGLQLMYDSYKVQLERMKNGVDFPIVKSPHIAIVGERGSGKTMLADIVVRFFRESGRCGEAEPVIVKAQSLVKDRMQQLAEMSNAVIIIENMEGMMNGDGSYPGAFLDDLRTVMTDGVDRRIIYIVTGSHEAMDKMKFYNKDIEDCFFHFIELEPYSTEELVKIMTKMAQERGFHIHKSCKPLLYQKLDAERKRSDFMNAIHLERLIRKAAENMVIRYKKRQEEINRSDKGQKIKEITTLLPEDFALDSNVDSVEALYAQLDAMTGLRRVKEEVRRQMNTVRMSLKAKTEGASRNGEHGTLHMIFAGEPGTGKTTVAEIVGKIYCAMGILPRGEQKIHIVSRADLISEYIGGTAKLVREICQRADGGVLFIDEAYSLINSEYDSYGHEAVDTLIQEMENRRNSMMVILAGYEKQMDEFLKANPGFRSRVPNVIHFDSYTTEELVDIFEYMVKAENYFFESVSVVNEAYNLIESKSQDPDFGNARGVRNLFEKIKYAQDERLARESLEGKRILKDDYDAIKIEDIRKTSGALFKGTKSIEELLEELKGLTGLSGVKRQVEEMINSVKYAELMKARGMDNGRGQGTKHIVFSGNPGTGKSTVASLLGQIYVKLGLLKKNTFVLAKRSDLIAEYQGQTAAKVANKVAEADGGILFIDEAYQLYTDQNDSYGIEAIGTLLSLVEEKRDTLMVILAGYSDDMDKFMSTNPGLRSRFPKVIWFEDYNLEELMEIFRNMCKKEFLKMEDGVQELVREEIRIRKEKDSREFANARGVRNLLEQIISRQNSRIISEWNSGREHSDEEMLTIKKEDVRP